MYESCIKVKEKALKYLHGFVDTKSSCGERHASVFICVIPTEVLTTYVMLSFEIQHAGVETVDQEWRPC